MMEPGHIEEFRRWAGAWFLMQGHPPNLLLVDPGLTTGLALVAHDGTMRSWSVTLSALPDELRRVMAGPMDAVICEDYSAHGKNVDPKATAAIGKGMVWSECSTRRIPMFLLQPNMKTSGRKQLDQAGLDARARAHNDHQRDVIDLAGKARHELQKAR